MTQLKNKEEETSLVKGDLLAEKKTLVAKNEELKAKVDKLQDEVTQ